jgi:membrane-associated phospholipid phosphatase
MSCKSVYGIVTGLMESTITETAMGKSRFFDWRQSSILKRVATLRIEEFIAYLFFVPCLAITLRANAFFWLEGYGMGRKIAGGLWRIGVVTALLPLIPYLSRKSETSRFFKVVRNALPFLIAIAIYTNLHDTIHFVNPNDVQDWFLRADIWLFGVEPTIWAQQFYRPWLTELLSFCYASYLPSTILIPLVLYIRRKDLEARETLLGIVLCFYWGYLLYILFPTVPPRLWIVNLYSRDFEGGMLLAAQRAMVSISESSSRAAFPSLHIAITLLTLTYAFRFVRKLFWVLLPLGIGLIVATIYLRHHYAVDLLAGIPLAILAYRYSPAWERKWERVRARLNNRGS